MRKLLFGVAALLLLTWTVGLAQDTSSDEGGRVLGLENAWSHAVEAKDTTALDMLLASSFVGVEIDGSVTSKSEFLAEIKAADYQPTQAINEQISVRVFGNAAVVNGIFREKGVEKGKPYVRRQRFTDTWIKQNEIWQCVASQATLIPGK